MADRAFAEERKLFTKAEKIEGTLEVPGDKSISHRALIFGAVARGKTVVKNFLKGEDCLSTLSCLEKLGAEAEFAEDGLVIRGKGFEGLTEPADILYAGNSGTTARLLLGILAGRPFYSVLSGDASLNNRPMARIVEPLEKMGAAFFGRQGNRYLPLSVIGGKLRGIRYEMPVASAQLKSALIFAGLQAEGVTTVIEKAPSRNHTEIMLRQFGGEIAVSGNRIEIPGGQRLQGTSIEVPGDFSSAAFFIAAAVLLKNSRLIIKNVGLNPTRTGLLDVLARMNARVEVVERTEKNGEPAGTLSVKSGELTGTVIEGDIIPRLIDEIPLIALLATQAEGVTVIRDAEELKVKETDRILAVANELSALGAKIEPTGDGMVITGKARLRGGTVDSHGDHRIGMMLSVAALLCDGEVRLKNPGCVAVSYPSFFRDLKRLIR